MNTSSILITFDQLSNLSDPEKLQFLNNPQGFLRDLLEKQKRLNLVSDQYASCLEKLSKIQKGLYKIERVNNLEVPLEQLESLPPNILKALNSWGLKNLSEVVKLSENNLLDIRDIGLGRIKELKRFLFNYQLKPGMSHEDIDRYLKGEDL